MHGHIQKCILLYGGSNPSSNASCKITKIFSWQTSLVKKMTNIFISYVVNLCIFHFSDQALPLLPPSLIGKCVLNAGNSVVIIAFNSALATGGGDGDYSGCYMTT
jgi:hypothetical protein